MPRSPTNRPSRTATPSVVSTVMCFSSVFKRRADRIRCFEADHAVVKQLDFQGLSAEDGRMYRQYQKRNSFGIDPGQKLCRIFQKRHYDQDLADGFLTLPRASAAVWNDELENPLADVTAHDDVTGQQVHLGSVVSSFYGMCWTKRANPTRSDWEAFSHGHKAVRVTTSTQKLLDRTMDINDPYYMLRSWLIEVDYKNPRLIRKLKTPDEVFRRMQSTGALLALSSAIVQTRYSGEQEVRFLFDGGLTPRRSDIVETKDPDLIRIPFDWNNFAEDELQYP